MNDFYTSKEIIDHVTSLMFIHLNKITSWKHSHLMNKTQVKMLQTNLAKTYVLRCY